MNLTNNIHSTSTRECYSSMDASDGYISLSGWIEFLRVHNEENRMDIAKSKLLLINLLSIFNQVISTKQYELFIFKTDITDENQLCSVISKSFNLYI